MATPLQTVKSQFGNKEALIAKLAPMLDRTADESDAQFKERLLRVSNGKLLRLWTREQSLREKFGNREALVDAIIALRGAGGKLDPEYRRRTLTLPTGRLLQMHTGLVRASKR